MIFLLATVTKFECRTLKPHLGTLTSECGYTSIQIGQEVAVIMQTRNKSCMCFLIVILLTRPRK